MLSAYKGIVVLALALFLAALLQAEGLRKQAEIQPSGFQRDLALRVTKPLVSFSRALHLTTPRHELQVAIGRENEDEIDTKVHLSLPPPATTPTPASHKPKPKPKPQHVKPLFTNAHPLRVWVAGDSLAQVPGDALERIGGAVDVVGVESRLSTGLARTSGFVSASATSRRTPACWAYAVLRSPCAFSSDASASARSAIANARIRSGSR